MIRKMEFRDIEEIKEIDKLCFKVDDERTTEGIRGYLAASNNSSLVYEDNNKVVGFNFIHIWGSFGWFGPFGVCPEYQGKGIGKALISETIRILKRDYGVSSIGLNTMPESQYNVGFYMNLGFTPLELSLNLKKNLDLSCELQETFPKKYQVNRMDINDEEKYSTLKENLKLMSNKVFNNFDLSSELLLIKNEGFGTTITLNAYEKIYGIAIVYKKSIRKSSSKNLQIKLTILDKDADYKSAMDCIIEFCIDYAKSIKYESISIDCNTYNSEICNYLMLKHRFKIEKTQVMMLMGESNPFKNNIILLTRLAG